MSRYGTVAAGASVTTRVAQSALAADLAAKVNAALSAAAANAEVVTAISLAGASDGRQFIVTVESAAMAAVVAGGLTAGSVVAYAGAERGALEQAALAAASVGARRQDMQVAGAGAGHPYMVLIVSGDADSGSAAGQQLAAVPLQPVSFNSSPTIAGGSELRGGVYTTSAGVQFSEVAFFQESSVPPWTAVIAIYQSSDGTVNGPAPLVATATFSDLAASSRHQVPIDGGGSAVLVPGLYWVVMGQSAGGGSFSLTGWEMFRTTLMNNQLAAGDFPTLFDTTVPASAPTATLDPLEGGASGVTEQFSNNRAIRLRFYQ